MQKISKIFFSPQEEHARLLQDSHERKMEVRHTAVMRCSTIPTNDVVITSPYLISKTNR